MKKLQIEKQLRKNRRLRWTMSLAVILVFVLGMVQLIVSNRLSDLGEEIETEKVKTESLTLENRLLEEQLRQKESLINVSEEAKKLGFIEAKSIYYLIPQIPVAMK
ncbi:MAG: hypothetical protein Q8P89_00080 [bacterium]|nr:hypothetical protein [bacterium]